jgi:hypothetical protein
MALICRSKRYLTKPVRILLFKSLVMSHLNYYSSIYSNVAKSLISPLITMQKKAIRTALGSAYNSHTDPLFGQTNTLKFADLMEYNNCKIAMSLVNYEAPIGLAECFRVIDPFNGDEADYKNTRSRTEVSLYTPVVNPVIL